MSDITFALLDDLSRVLLAPKKPQFFAAPFVLAATQFDLISSTPGAQTPGAAITGAGIITAIGVRQDGATGWMGTTVPGINQMTINVDGGGNQVISNPEDFLRDNWHGGVSNHNVDSWRGGALWLPFRSSIYLAVTSGAGTINDVAAYAIVCLNI